MSLKKRALSNPFNWTVRLTTACLLPKASSGFSVFATARMKTDPSKNPITIVKCALFIATQMVNWGMSAKTFARSDAR